jgi:hypothetical protein
VTFNQPEDYNFDTGLVEVAGNYKKDNGEFGRNYPAQKQVYRVATVKHTFSRGSFTQELEGMLYQDVLKQKPSSKPSANEGRPRTGPTDAQARAADQVIAQSAQAGNGSSVALEFGGSDDLALATGSAEPPGNSTVPPNQNLDRNTQPLRNSNSTSTGGIINITRPVQSPDDSLIVAPDGISLIPRPGTGPDVNNKPPQYGNREA